MNYKIFQEANLFNVVETATNQVVFTHSVHAEAKKVMRHMNLGGGFDGFTPAFMILKPAPILNKNSRNM